MNVAADRLFLSGNDAVAHAACAAQVSLGTGYPGTPCTEILETFSSPGGKAQLSPNAKVAADVLFTAAYTSVSGALVGDKLTVIVARRPCLLIVEKSRSTSARKPGRTARPTAGRML